MSMSKKKIVCTLVSFLTVLATVLGCVFGIEVDFDDVLPDDAYVVGVSDEAHGQN